MHVAIGQIANQLIFVSITSQESLPVRRNRRSFKHAFSLRSATVRSTIDCFKLFVRYFSQSISTLLTVSSWEVIYGRIISWEYSSNVDKLRAWPYAQLQPRRKCILAGCEDFVRHPIRSDFDPCRSWPISEMDGGHAWFSCSKKLSRLNSISFCMQCRDERRKYNLSSKMRLVPCYMTSALLEVYWTVPIYSLTQCHSVVCWMHFQPVLHKFTELTLTDLFHYVYCSSLFMTTFVSRVSMSPLSLRNGFLMSSNVANREYTIV